jgi:hypothetical protein
MLSPTRVAQIEELLAAGKLSQRQIARKERVSRNTVASIAAELRRRQRKALEEELPPPARCPGCGGMVYMPCRLCRLRAFLVRRKRRQAWRRRVRS